MTGSEGRHAPPQYSQICKKFGQKLARQEEGWPPVLSVTFFSNNLVIIVGQLVRTLPFPNIRCLCTSLDKLLEFSQHHVHDILYTDKSSFTYIDTKNFLRSQKSSTELSKHFEQLSTTFLKTTFLLNIRSCFKLEVSLGFSVGSLQKSVYVDLQTKNILQIFLATEL